MWLRERKLLFAALMVVVMALVLGAMARAGNAGEGQVPAAAGEVAAGRALAPPPPPAAPSPPPARALAASRTITFSYDANGRLTGVDYGEGKAITYRYDNAGNLTQQAVGPAASPTAAPRVYIPALLKDSPGGW